MRFDDVGHMVVCRQHDVVDILLFLREFPAYGVGAGVVGAVVVDRFAARVAQQQTPLFQYAVGVEVMQRFAVLRDDRRERHARTVGFGDAFDGARDFALDDARAAHLHGQRVHLVADLERALHLFDLLGALFLAHFGHGEHQVYRLVVVQQCGFDTQQRRQPKLCLSAVRGQEMDFAPQRNGFAEPFLEFGEGICRCDADLCAQLAQRGLRACPDDVLDREIVAVECLFARVGVDQARQRGDVQPEIVEERRILPEIVGVVRIVVGRKGVARQQDDP